MSLTVKIILLMAAAAAVTAYILMFNHPEETVQVFRTTGTVEAVETSISSKIPGRLASVLYREGEPVKAGEVIATIDPEEYEAALSQAEAAADAARAALNSGYAAVETAKAQSAAAKSRIDGASADVRRAEAALSQAGKDLARAEQLYDQGIVPKSDLDTAVTASDTAVAGLEAAKAALASVSSLADASDAALRESIARVETLRADVGVAQSAVELARTRLADTVIHSPVDATVEYRTLEPGEVVAAGTSILTLAGLDGLWVRFDLDESYTASVRTGDIARVTLEYMPDKVFDAVIFDIGREAEFAVERDVTRGRQDIRTFRTRARLDDPEGILKPGMTVTVAIPLNHNI